MTASIISVVPTIPGSVPVGNAIKISATDGVETIANALGVFAGGIDPDFQRWGMNVAGKPTAATKAQIFEMKGDGNFEAIFKIPGRTSESLAWEQSQVVALCQHSKCCKLLGSRGYTTFFLFKVKKKRQVKFFVALVYPHSGGRLKVGCYCFEDGFVWHAKFRYRIVLPQESSASDSHS